MWKLYCLPPFPIPFYFGLTLSRGTSLRRGSGSSPVLPVNIRHKLVWYLPHFLSRTVSTPFVRSFPSRLLGLHLRTRPARSSRTGPRSSYTTLYLSLSTTTVPCTPEHPVIFLKSKMPRLFLLGDSPSHGTRLFITDFSNTDRHPTLSLPPWSRERTIPDPSFPVEMLKRS